MPPELLIQVSLTESDIPACSRQLLSSLQSFLDFFADQVTILIVYQTRSGTRPAELNSASPGMEVKTTNRFSASAARNLGIARALELNCRYILFHDAKVSYCQSFIDMIKTAMINNLDFCRGKAVWTEEVSSEASAISAGCAGVNGRPPRQREQPPLIEARLKRLSPIRHTYLWVYLFKTALVEKIRFNENIGPGRDTGLNAGEDTLFLCSLAAREPRLRVWYFPMARVFHPPRPPDLSKHAAYARAQGVMFRLFLTRKFRPYWYFLLYLILFVGAASGRVLLLRKNSLKSAREFAAGFLDRDNRRSLLATER